MQRNPGAFVFHSFLFACYFIVFVFAANTAYHSIAKVYKFYTTDRIADYSQTPLVDSEPDFCACNMRGSNLYIVEKTKLSKSLDDSNNTMTHNPKSRPRRVSSEPTRAACLARCRCLPGCLAFEWSEETKCCLSHYSSPIFLG